MTAPARQLSDANPGGSGLGQSATDLISFYGATPIAQRASAVQATSNVSLTTFMTINTNVAAFCLEVANTLIGLGLWKGSA
jgi:hypothetical protein